MPSNENPLGLFFGAHLGIAWSFGRKCKTAKVHCDRHIKGAKVLGESSVELSFLGAKRPGSERAMERIGQGAK